MVRCDEGSDAYRRRTQGISMLLYTIESENYSVEILADTESEARTIFYRDITLEQIIEFKGGPCSPRVIRLIRQP
jgi:hypothetical protein